MNEQVETIEEKKAVVPLNERAKQIMTPAMGEIMKALPSTLKPDKFEAAFVAAVISNSDILRCSEASLRSALLKAAADGQLPDGRHAALVPNWNSKKGTLEATYVPMVKGIVNKAAEQGNVVSITAEVVYAEDELIIDLADPSKTIHTFPGFGVNRGECVGAYAIFRAKGGEVIHRELMDRADIDKARNASKMKKSVIWEKWFGEMVRKTVIRRGSKYVPMSADLRQIIERDDEHVSFKEEKPEDWNPLSEAHNPPQDMLGDVLDGEAEEVDLPPEDDVSMMERLVSEVDVISEVAELREFQEEWSVVISGLHDHCRKVVLDTINVRYSQLEEE